VSKKRTITIIVETDQLMIVRKSHRIRAWDEETEHTMIEERALLTDNKPGHLPVTAEPQSVSASEALRSAISRTIRELTRNFTKKA
jgi:hypothetical protein